MAYHQEVSTDNHSTYRILSDFKSQSGNYDEAYSLSQKALVIAQCSAETTLWVSASLYKLGCIRLKQRRIQDALSVLIDLRFNVHS